MNSNFSEPRKVSFNVRVPEEIKEDLRKYANEFQLTLEELANGIFSEFLRERPTAKKEVRFIRN